MRSHRILLTLSAAAALGACGSARDLSSGSSAECAALPTGTTCPAGSTLTYASFGRNFFATYCLRCHSAAVTGDARNGATPGVNFDTLEGILDHRCRVDDYAGNGPNQNRKVMPFQDNVPPLSPPLALPSDLERQQLSQWIACGSLP